ncbi:MAG: glutamine amidotransferase [Cyanobacteria bacterium REEB67]|nr:glutamine amidotransferase [Cyanobacteria bacterium REEB67]
MELRIAHLYAHFLNIYGDRGNIITLTKRAQWRGIEVKVDAIDLAQQADPDYYDLYFVGGGQDKQQIVIAEDLLKRANDLKSATSSGAVMLSVCGGYQLLGHYYKPHEGPELKGISLLDAYTVAGNRRMIGNVTIKGDDGSFLVGFENHSGKTYLGQSVPPLGKIVVGNGNNGEDKTEGAASGTIYGTYLHGSLLPKNPQFADRLLQQALSRRYGDVNLTKLDDSLENQAHKRALSLPA